MLIWVLLLTLALPGTMLSALAEGEQVQSDNPPVSEEPSPAEQPPAEEPPAEQPPAEEAPVIDPLPAEEPPVIEESFDFAAQTFTYWDKSSLTSIGQGGDCQKVYAVFKNGGSGMDGTTTWELYWSATGNPKYGSKIASGTIPALSHDGTYEASFNPQNNSYGPDGNYMFKAFQRPGHPGTGSLWSEQISISGCVLTPGIDLVKSVNPTSAMVGETVTYTFTITNSGSKNLYKVELDDNDINFHPDSFGTSGDPFKPGDVKTFTKDFVVTADCDDEGSFVNHASVKGYWDKYSTQSKYKVTDDATATLTIIKPAPAIAISKLVKEVGTEGDFAESIMLTKAPATVEYKIVVTNTGNVAVDSITVTDPMLPGSPFNVGTLAAGASFEIPLVSYGFQYGDAFPVVNTATAVGSYSGLGIDCIPPQPNPQPVVVGPVSDSATVGFEMNPGITLEKKVKLQGSELDAVDDLVVSELPANVEYHFLITNTGNMKLYDVHLLDEKLFGLDVEHQLGISLDPGETKEVTYNFTITSMDETSKFVNVAQVCGNFYPQVVPEGLGAAVAAPQFVCSMRDDASVTHVVPGQPAIDIEKTVNDNSVLTGTQVTYTLTVTNIGNVTLYNVQVSDPALGYNNSIAELAPAEVKVFTIDKELTTADRNDGLSFLNTATATGSSCPEQYEGIGQSAIIYPIECVEVTDTDSVSVLITTGGGGGTPGGGGTGTGVTTTVVEPEPIPEGAPEVIPASTPEPTPVILEEAVPLGVPVLPKTGEMDPTLFYGLGSAFAALGLIIRRKF